MYVLCRRRCLLRRVLVRVADALGAGLGRLRASSAGRATMNMLMIPGIPFASGCHSNSLPLRSMMDVGAFISLVLWREMKKETARVVPSMPGYLS